MGPDRVLDIRTEACPYTFVKTRLALEDLVVGQLLTIILGNAESAESVPRSLRREGQEVLAVTEEAGPAWQVVVRKVHE